MSYFFIVRFIFTLHVKLDNCLILLNIAESSYIHLYQHNLNHIEMSL